MPIISTHLNKYHFIQFKEKFKSMETMKGDR